MKSFASDNFSGVHPNVMAGMTHVNQGHTPGYGTDKFTEEAVNLINATLGATDTFLMLNGTGTNITILDYLTDSHGAVICSSEAHIFTHESGAASKVGNVTLIPLPSEDGKITVDGIAEYVSYRDDYHCPRPQVISITQPTEMGAVYTIDELKEITTYAHEMGMKVHMDGARIGNAAVSLGFNLKSITGDVGIDALSFGMCKNGMMFGEAAVFFNNINTDSFNYTRKQNLQLQSKMRYIASQYISMLTGDLWKENATTANDVAKYFQERLEANDKAQVVHGAAANIMFVKFPENKVEELKEFMYFYTQGDTARLVTSFDSSKEEVDAFMNVLNK